jgi:hypothetical protein
VRLTYIAGVVTIPDYIKKAILEIAMATKARGGQSDRTKYTVGRVSRTFTTDSYITPTVARLLQPFRVHSYY